MSKETFYRQLLLQKAELKEALDNVRSLIKYYAPTHDDGQEKLNTIGEDIWVLDLPPHQSNGHPATIPSALPVEKRPSGKKKSSRRDGTTIKDEIVNILKSSPSLSNKEITNILNQDSDRKKAVRSGNVYNNLKDLQKERIVIEHRDTSPKTWSLATVRDKAPKPSPDVKKNG